MCTLQILCRRSNLGIDDINPHFHLNDDPMDTPVSLWPWPDEDLKEVLEGLVMSNSNLMLVEDHNIVLRKDHISLSQKVKIASGGKLGNEPLYMSYVGPGMLTGVVLGTRYTPPSPSEIHIFLKELAYDNTGGILLIIPNSREEVLNFGLGLERARCDNIMVDMITVGDDAYDTCKNDFGRRCLAGIVLMFKIAGAMAEAGKNMKEIYIYLRKIQLSTISCHIIKSSFIGTDFHLGSGEFIDTTNISYLVSRMLDYIVSPKKYFSLPVKNDSNLILFLNCYTYDRFLLYGAVKEVIEQLTLRDVNIKRIYAGTFVSGDRGFSISLAKGFDDSISSWMDSFCVCYSWPRSDPQGRGLVFKGPLFRPKPTVILGPYVDDQQLKVVDYSVIYACKALRNSEAFLNSLDLRKTYGSSLIEALDKILAQHEAGSLNTARPYNMLMIIADICEDLVPTILGTIFCIFFSGAAQAFLHFPKTTEVKATMWMDGLFKGISAVKMFTHIKEGDMSFLDILSPFAYKLKTSEAEDIVETLTISIEKCEEILEGHSKLKSPLKHDDLPEVNCQATVTALRAIVEGIRAAFTADLAGGEGLDEEESFEIC